MGFIEKGVADATNKIGEASNYVTDLVSSKRQFVIKQVTNVFLLLVILIVFGCFDFLHLKFHYEYLLDQNYWVDIVIKAIADICSYNIGVNFIIDDVIKRNIQLVNLKYQYERLNEVKQEDFQEFIDEYNKEQKALAFKSYINHKIYLLNKFSRKSDRLLYSRVDCRSGYVGRNRYCKKRHELEQMKTDEFIHANIDSLEAPYKDVDAAIFELEINGTEKIVQNKVTGSLARGRTIASVSTMFGVIAFAMIIKPVALDPSKQEFVDGAVAAANYAVSIASDIGIIIWQFTRGILGTHKIVSNQMTVPLAERVKILKRYYEWRKEKGKFVPQCYYDLLAGTLKPTSNDDSEELSQEEYDLILKRRKEQKEKES